jgi:hypothetical protein
MTYDEIYDRWYNEGVKPTIERNGGTVTQSEDRYSYIIELDGDSFDFDVKNLVEGYYNDKRKLSTAFRRGFDEMLATLSTFKSATPEGYKKNIRPFLKASVISERIFKDVHEHVPYKKIGDLYFVYQFGVYKKAQNFEKSGIVPIYVREPHLKKWGVDIDTIHKDAMKCIADNIHISVTPLKETLSEELKAELPEHELGNYIYVLRSDYNGGVDGTVGLFGEGTMKKIAEEYFDGNFYVIPVSLNEVFLIGDMDVASVEDLVDRVKFASTHIPDGGFPVLSEKLYHYDMNLDRFELEKDYRKRLGRFFEA